MTQLFVRELDKTKPAATKELQQLHREP